MRWQPEAEEPRSDKQVQAYYDRVNRVQDKNQAEYRDTFDVDFVHHVPLLVRILSMAVWRRG